MSEIKQINTGVAELLAVKVPEGATGYTVIGGKIIFDLRHGLNNKRFALPPGKWAPLGIDTELTEDQAREVMGSDRKPFCKLKFYNPSLPECGFSTAKEAFASLMQANEVYSKNPYGGKPNERDMLDFDKVSDFEKAVDQWNEAEANTGPHLILKPGVCDL